MTEKREWTIWVCPKCGAFENSPTGGHMHYSAGADEWSVGPRIPITVVPAPTQPLYTLDETLTAAFPDKQEGGEAGG